MDQNITKYRALAEQLRQLRNSPTYNRKDEKPIKDAMEDLYFTIEVDEQVCLDREGWRYWGESGIELLSEMIASNRDKREYAKEIKEFPNHYLALYMTDKMHFCIAEVSFEKFVERFNREHCLTRQNLKVIHTRVFNK